MTERLTFKEMCAKFDVTPRTLRYYEYIESREIARMTLIIRGRRFGFSLEELRQWLLIYDEKGTQAQLENWVEIARRQLGKLDEQITELTEARADLQILHDDVLKSLKK